MSIIYQEDKMYRSSNMKVRVGWKVKLQTHTSKINNDCVKDYQRLNFMKVSFRISLTELAVVNIY